MRVAKMAGEQYMLRHVKLIGLCFHGFLIRTLTSKHNGEFFAAPLQVCRRLKQAQYALFPVYLPNEKENGVSRINVEFLYYSLLILVSCGAHLRAVFDYYNVARVAVFAQHHGGGFAYSPNLVAAFIEVHNEFYAYIGDKLRICGLIKIVVIFGMECAYQRQIIFGT